MSLIQEYHDKANALKQFLKDNGETMAQEILSTAFDGADPSIKYAIIYAFTPGFNDGDPCTHCQYCELGSEIKDMAEDNEEFILAILGKTEEELEESGEDMYDLLEELELPDIDYNLRRVVSLRIDEQQDILEEVYGTNWSMLLVRQDDGTVKTVFNEYYDCGY